eukprot:4756691-Amphidinium_carterae.1
MSNIQILAAYHAVLFIVSTLYTYSLILSASRCSSNHQWSMQACNPSMLLVHLQDGFVTFDEVKDPEDMLSHVPTLCPNAIIVMFYRCHFQDIGRVSL